LISGSETANTYGIDVPGCNPLTREDFSDQVDNSGSGCQCLLPLVPIEDLVGQTPWDPIWIAGWDVVETRSPRLQDGIESTVERISPVKKVRNRMADHSFLPREVQERLCGFSAACWARKQVRLYISLYPDVRPL